MKWQASSVLRSPPPSHHGHASDSDQEGERQEYPTRQHRHGGDRLGRTIKPAEVLATRTPTFGYAVGFAILLSSALLVVAACRSPAPKVILAVTPPVSPPRANVDATRANDTVNIATRCSPAFCSSDSTRPSVNLTLDTYTTHHRSRRIVDALDSAPKCAQNAPEDTESPAIASGAGRLP
jgi:hypothetical protein